MEQNKEDMKMLRPTATSVRAEEGYILDVEFDNGERKRFDVKPYIKARGMENWRTRITLEG